MKKRFIETVKLPIQLINEKSGVEKKGGGRPPFWEMVFWWTRKPLIGARSVIAASLLPEDANKHEFVSQTRLNQKTPHRHLPLIFENKKFLRYFKGKKMLDPFAGFGSIPLEGLRLGLAVTASELLPTAYIFLKAVLEYPLKYGNKLVEDVKKWGEWISEGLKEDEEIKKLYDEAVAVYIGTWEVKCPHCRKWTPLIGNWWLARVKDSKGKYKRLAYMDYKKSGDGVEIKVVDVNKEVAKNVKVGLGDAIADAEVDTSKGKIIVNSTTYKVPSSNLNSRREQAICLNCGSIIRFVDADGNHYTDKKDVAKDVRNELEWYVRWALKRYHEGDESYARQRLLVRIKIENGDLVFEPCDERDNEKLMKAKEKINELERKGDVDIPYESTQPYTFGSVGGGALSYINWGYTYWRRFFNPRQLLTLRKLVKLIREAGKNVEMKKKKEGWSEEKARKYAEGITTYLSVALCKYSDYSSLVSRLHPTNPRGVDIASSLSDRGISMKWNICENNPICENDYISGIFTNSGSLRKILNGLLKAASYLHQGSLQPKLTSERSDSKIKIFIDDATTLSKINDKFDIIVTDPPYADDVPYTELSDFYYVWLKRALSDVEGGKLVPRFHADAFFKKIGDKYVEIKTQWQEFAKREVSTNAGRFMREKKSKKKAEEHFQNLLTQSFIAMREHLRENGLLVTYYAHTSPEAWANLLEAGWKGAKATITNAFPLATESTQRVTARGKLALDTSVVVVWRIGKQERERNIVDLREEIIEAAKNRTKGLIKQSYIGRDVLVGAMAAALNIVTRYRGLYDARGDLDVSRLLTEYVYPFTAIGIAESLREIAKVGEIKSPEALFYLLVKALFGSREKFISKKMDRSDINLLKISTRVDTNKLINDNIIKEVKEGYKLQEPATEETSALERFLKEERRINLAKPRIRNSLDILHLMEYYTLLFPTSKLKKRWEGLCKDYSLESEEAFTLSEILMRILPHIDPEGSLADKFVGKLEGKTKTVQQTFFRKEV